MLPELCNEEVRNPPLWEHSADPRSGVSESHSMYGLVPDVPSSPPQSQRVVTQMTQF